MIYYCADYIILTLPVPFSYTDSPMDYGAVSTILRFDACDTRRCVDVTIENDGDDEPDEVFGITLERTPSLNGRITLDPVDGDITIVDNDIDGMILKHSKHYSNTRILVYTFIIQQIDFHILFVYLLSFTPVGIVCSAVGRSEVEITCEGIEPSVSLQCSFSGGPLHPCEIVIDT